MSNAVKFTPRGGSVAVRLFERGNGRVVLEVSDTGMGIAAVDQERLFQRFFRAEAARSKAIQGTGLGLSIAKTIVEGHSGRITVESTDGVGTTFQVSLPKAPVLHEATRRA